VPRKPKVTSLQRRPSTLPGPPGDSAGGALALREKMLAVAGITEAELGAALRASFDTLRAQLDVTKVQRLVVRVARDQETVQEYTDADTSSQRSAALALIDLIGAMPSRASGSVNIAGKQIVVRFADYDEPRPVAITVEGEPKPQA
jgi:hypothetical protein